MDLHRKKLFLVQPFCSYTTKEQNFATREIHVRWVYYLDIVICAKILEKKIRLYVTCIKITPYKISK
jgi:hypothetical protein